MTKSPPVSLVSLFLVLFLLSVTPVDSYCTIPSGFGPGEQLIYDVDWGLINAGETELSILDTVRVNGHLCYHLLSRTHSNNFVTTFFKVDDRVESMMDVAGLFSRGFQKHLREGDYREDRWFRISQEEQLVFQLDTTATTKYTADTLQVEFGVQDVLSALQYVRLQDLEPGTEIRVMTVDNLNPYELVVKVHRRQRVKVPAGRFDCLVVEPLLKSTGLFKSKGKLTIWLTDDERRLPVLMKSKILI
ncbi:MAG: DUF3108 domain-containing protein, partial [Candidatus Delongbacteria bacterium]|nr:DUF3108 domain-containing protein [Candidatus Delongbacteria bacterium]